MRFNGNDDGGFVFYAFGKTPFKANQANVCVYCTGVQTKTNKNPNLEKKMCLIYLLCFLENE